MFRDNRWETSNLYRTKSTSDYYSLPRTQNCNRWYVAIPSGAEILDQCIYQMPKAFDEQLGRIEVSQELILGIVLCILIVYGSLFPHWFLVSVLTKLIEQN